MNKIKNKRCDVVNKLGKTYKRVIKQVAEREQISVIDALIKVYNSFLSEKIDDYNSSMYYEIHFIYLNTIRIRVSKGY